MTSSNKVPHVVFIEGADGVGKTSVTKSLVSLLKALGISVETALIMQSHEAGFHIRQNNITEELQDELRFVGYCYGTFYGIDKIFQKYNTDVVIVDRSQASTFAQNICAAPDMDNITKNAAIQIFNQLNNTFKNKYKGKYTNIYLEVDPQVALERISKNRGPLDVFEKRGPEFQERIKAGFESYYYQNKNPLQLRFNTGKQTPEQICTYIATYLKENVLRYHVT